MTRILLITLILLSVKYSYAQKQQVNPAPSQTSTGGAKATFDNTVCDFGIIGYNSPGSHIYTITNTGTEPLIIYNCVKGCGCTSVEWTKTPIKPGEKGYVKAAYNTKKIGQFSRGVDVYTNDPNNIKINIRLKGEVLVLPGGEAPPVITDDSKEKSPATPDTKW